MVILANACGYPFVAQWLCVQWSIFPWWNFIWDSFFLCMIRNRVNLIFHHLSVEMTIFSYKISKKSKKWVRVILWNIDIFDYRENQFGGVKLQTWKNIFPWSYMCLKWKLWNFILCVHFFLWVYGWMWLCWINPYTCLHDLWKS